MLAKAFKCLAPQGLAIADVMVCYDLFHRAIAFRHLSPPRATQEIYAMHATGVKITPVLPVLVPEPAGADRSAL